MEFEYLPYLRKCSLFAKLEDNLLRMLEPGCLWVRLRGGDLLFHEGAPGGSLYVVVEGEVAVERVRFRGDDKEDVVNLGLRRPYDVIGEMSLFGDERRTASVRATVERTTLLMVDGRYVMQCVERSHSLAIAMLKEVVKKLTDAAEQQSELRTDPIKVRLARLLLDLNDIHGDPQPDGSVELSCVVTQAELARRIGCSREVVNKHLKSFGERAVEMKRGRIHLGAVERLRRVVDRGY